MNQSKTKVMTNSTRCKVKVDGQSIQYVNEYLYLNQLASFSHRQDKEIERWMDPKHMEELFFYEGAAERQSSFSPKAMLMYVKCHRVDGHSRVDSGHGRLTWVGSNREQELGGGLCPAVGHRPKQNNNK